MTNNVKVSSHHAGVDSFESLFLCPSNASANNDWCWHQIIPMLKARRGPRGAHFNGRVVVAGGHPGERTTVESLQPPTSDHTESYWTELIGPDICSPDSQSLAVFKGSLMQLGEMVPVLGTSIKWVAF
ncbi:unnamed protein product [Mesocestoides corti]|uniref:Uncharacterized protein n=1 Tax=Mesocestoides corti TaxID=53468 RepID=A0A3P6GY28_MESCO|nr:unnamed protein product [Mesocestoides corti]